VWPLVDWPAVKVIAPDRLAAPAPAQACLAQVVAVHRRPQQVYQWKHADTDFWKDLEKAVNTIIGEGPGRRVIVNPQTNLVIVRALPSELRVVEDFLGVTARTINRQVVLEAKIIEVELKIER